MHNLKPLFAFHFATSISKEPTNLFSPDKSLWQEAILNTYGMPISDNVMEYKHGQGAHKTVGSQAFDTATKQTQAWIKRWKSNYNAFLMED